eukprot:13445367-Alexandrium_andersonii.AAC.1
MVLVPAAVASTKGAAGAAPLAGACCQAALRVRLAVSGGSARKGGPLAGVPRGPAGGAQLRAVTPSPPYGGN